jgi:aminocarboxymuconate-semialdehyde decarboxylase
MILGGAFDRLPPALRICFAHGGGSFAFWLGRLENAWRRRGDIVRGCSEHPPSYYLDRILVDTVVFESAPLRLLVDTLGEDRVLVGSDYPYPLGERPVGEVVRKSGFLTAEQQHKLLTANALSYLGRSE